MGFLNEIICWYKVNKRDLPWRKTNSPYEIFLSEIILQQTRVEQGLPYFHKFKERYPDVYSLAQAYEQDVLALWQGLGYYSRARNLLKAARKVVLEYNGQFPEDYHLLKKLPGVGDYTAAAIASFAFHKKIPAIDGNVLRVMSRILNDYTPVDKVKKHYFMIANEWIQDFPAAIYNQAMMEFGALVCTPKPKCDLCPVVEYCEGFKQKSINQLPVKAQKIKKKDRYFYFLDIQTSNGKIIVEKRVHSDIWKNMYQLPLIESSSFISDQQILHKIREKQIEAKSIEISPINKHVLTHQNIYYSIVSVCASLPEKNNFTEISIKEIPRYPFPNIIRKYLEEKMKLYQ